MAVDIYTYWDSTPDAPERQAELMRLWERSWSARGWNPRILTIRNAKRHKMFKQTHPASYYLRALEAVGGGYYAGIHAINFCFAPPKKKIPKKSVAICIPSRRYLELGWEESEIVCFDNCSPEAILECGRKL